MADNLVAAPDEVRAQLRRLEAELEEYPDQQGEIMLEIASARLKLGEPDRAIGIWRDLIAEGGEDCDYARVALAEHRFDQGQDEAARDELAALKATRRTSGGGWQLAAELLEERGELTESLVWYTMATERFTADELTVLGEDFGWTSLPGMLVRRRRTIRALIGLPPDETDLLVPTEQEIQRAFRRPFQTAEDAVDTIRARRGTPAEVRMLFWPRSEFDAARNRWPEAMDQDLSETQYYEGLETKLGDMAREGASRVNVVPCSLYSFAAYFDAAGDSSEALSAAKREYLDARYREGRYLQWPPARNQPCWCGSGAKYKKCCGAPSR